ncbi:hypothetical protein F4782DRAFT_530612 [Xylaria castorea]|nr:hypothetical protein F4782DRAFT_530612 [Xylaria castorea]
MAESGYNSSSADQLTDTPDVTLIFTSINESNGSVDSNTSALEAPIKEEDQFELHVDEESQDRDDPHQPGLPTGSGGVFPYLQKALNSTEVDVLSRHQSAGACLLGELTRILSSNTKCIDISRISSIKSLQKRANTPRTIIGVVGATGHGKSSLINTLLEEDKLVPTNCFRACTAVVTEVSYNYSDNPDHRYIAEIEFISVDDWDRELGYLFHDLNESSGEASVEGQLEGSDAGIAWAKIKAVYPTLTKKTIEQTSAKALASDPAVKWLLGTTKTVREPTASELYKATQIYMGSKKKTSFAPLDSEENDSGPKMELWPLIKVVRIYTKADVLSSGAVIVDLPGVQDSNAARAAVAGKYIEQCDSLLVVSMITRAVDDQAAQELLGAGFKQQLKLDGNYSKVTFVCSKTDDINIDEAAEALGLVEDAKKLSSLGGSLSTLEASSELEKLQERINAISNYAEEVDDHIDRYEKLKGLQANGRIVTPPKGYPRKRKTGSHVARASKRRRVAASMDERSEYTQWVSTEDHWGDLEKGMPKFSAEHPLTQQDIQSMIDYLRSRKKTAIDEKKTLMDRIDNDENRLEDLRDEVSKLEEQLHVACVARRNDCSRQVIRRQFALGLKELDQQEAQSIDPNNLDQEKDFRDYAQIGHSLPVFCISSRAHQALANKKQVGGFSNLNDTEIPQLRAHMKKLTGVIRITNAKSFLNDLAQALNSLYLWSSEKGIEDYLTDEEKKAEMGCVREQVNKLEKRLLSANEDLVGQLNDILKALFRCFEAAAVHAAGSVPGIVHRWPTHKRGDGGLLYMSYKATINRDGVFSGKNGPRNFNEDLATPFIQKIGNDWETTFTKKIPKTLDLHAKTCQVHQEHIQGLIKSRLQERVAFKDIIDMLQDQDIARSNGLNNKITSLISDIRTSQRDANRDFTPAIQKWLMPTYTKCSQDKGRGVFDRIKVEMYTEITSNRRAIFRGSYESVKAKLSEIPKNIQEDLGVLTDVMLDGMLSDYSNVILKADNSEEANLIRGEVFELLKGVDERFR